MTNRVQSISKNNQKYLSLLNNLNNVLEDCVDNDLDIEEFNELSNEIEEIETAYEQFKTFLDGIFNKVSASFKNFNKETDYEIYFNKLISEGKKNEILDFFIPKAKRGDPESSYFIGKLYLFGCKGHFGENIGIDYEKAMKFTKHSIKKGENNKYYYQLALIYEKTNELDKAIQFYNKSFYKNDIRSGYSLLSVYNKKLKTERNKEKIFEIKSIMYKIRDKLNSN